MAKYVCAGCEQEDSEENLVPQNGGYHVHPNDNCVMMAIIKTGKSVFTINTEMRTLCEKMER